tara:strand:+ start:258 stop:1010 length:753 start_codon:yes stop_codon:yes gene_type:complete
MKRLIALLLVSTIGFSQDCENSVLDELLLNEEVNEYFQLALSLSLDDLAFLNNCDDTTTYTIFAPGNNVPTSSVATLLALDGQLIDYILYYVTSPQMDMGNYCPDNPDEGYSLSTNIEMMDGNQAIFTCGVNGVTLEPYMAVNDVTSTTTICTCNASIYILNDLIWAPGINLEENSQSLSLYPNPAKNVLNVSKVVDLGVLELVDMNGKVLLSKEIDTDIQIDISNYKKGIYLINFISEKEGFTQMIAIN